MELRAVDLDDQAGVDQVRFLPRYLLVDGLRVGTGVVEDLERSGLGVGAAAAVGDAGVVVVQVLEPGGTSAVLVPRQAYCERVRSGELESPRLPQWTGGI